MQQMTTNFAILNINEANSENNENEIGSPIMNQTIKSSEKQSEEIKSKQQKQKQQTQTENQKLEEPKSAGCLLNPEQI